MASSSQVESLRSRCISGRTKMVGKFTAGGVDVQPRPGVEGPAAGRRAWGQYIDVLSEAPERELGSQFGIYGTTAALQVYAMAGAVEHEAKIRAGITAMPLIDGESDEGDPVRQHFVSKGDLRVVHKVCALLDAAILAQTESDDNCSLKIESKDLAAKLCEMRIPTAGWPDYVHESTPGLDGDPHATAVALLSLSAYSGNEFSDHCKEALLWLRKREIEQWSIATLSMVVIATNRLADVVRDSKELCDFRDRSERALDRWIGSTSAADILRLLAATEHWQPREASRDDAPSASRFDFLIYIPHCLAVLAVLNSAKLRRSSVNRTFALKVVEIVADSTNRLGYFVAAGRSVVATVEQYWIYRMLKEFDECEFYNGRWNVFVDWVRSGWVGRVVIPVIVVVTAAAVVLQSAANGVVQSIATTVTQSLVVIFAALAVAFVREKV